MTDIIVLGLVYVALSVACGVVIWMIGRPSRADFSETQRPWRIIKSGPQPIVGQPANRD
ncbi:MAG TPA: hypothetical protein VMI56_20050 [Reyranella sp.]|nr:hypothetical protein [Reyranella sp.]